MKRIYLTLAILAAISLCVAITLGLSIGDVKSDDLEVQKQVGNHMLIGMGVLPLQFKEGDTPTSLGLDGTESFSIPVTDDVDPRQEIQVTATKTDGSSVTFATACRLDTPVEVDYYRNGGILHYVLRNFLNKSAVEA